MGIFFKRKKRAIAAGLAAVMLAMPILSNSVSAFVLDLNNAYVADTWDESVTGPAMVGQYANYKPTGMAFNQNFYFGAGTNGWPLGAAMYLEPIDGKDNSGFEDFEFRHTFCTANHTSAASIQPGARAFLSGRYRYTDNLSEMFPAAKKGTTNEEIRMNFLMLAIACYYPGEYTINKNAQSIAEDSAAAEDLVSQLVAWICTNNNSTGFNGNWEHDYNYFKSYDGYYNAMMNNFAEKDPSVHAKLNSALSPTCGAAKAGMTNYADGCFWDIWTAANLTRQLTPDWDKQLQTFKTTIYEQDGEYHADINLFVSEEAKVYLDGVSFMPSGDWVSAGTTEDGVMHFTSPTGALDENGSIGYLYWPEDKIGYFMPVDETKAQIVTFDTYNLHADPPAFGRTQTQFTSVIDKGIQIYLTEGGGDDPDNPGTGTSTGEGTYSIEIHRYEHQENWEATYNVNLLKYDSETGKPLADSHWDILEMFDDSQLDDTDLDRTPDSPGEYTSGLGTLNETTFGDDEISTNYSGNTGVTESDTNKYNWGNDGGTQFETWDDPDNDPCVRDDNVTGEDGLLYEIDSSENRTDVLAHTDIKDYTYNKGYCGGHPAPTINYVECDHEADEDCDCDEVNQELHDEAWAAWYKEVQKCEQLVEQGGFFHCIDPGDAAKEALQTDRDEFFKDFISLTYDYSAKEIEAPKGYIIHGTHTDDIPIEWRTVTSSEYKDTDQATVLDHSGGSSDSEDIGDADSTENEESLNITGENSEKSFLISNADQISTSDSGKEKDDPVWESAGYADDNADEEKNEAKSQDEKTDDIHQTKDSAADTESKADMDTSDDEADESTPIVDGKEKEQPVDEGNDTESAVQPSEENENLSKDSGSLELSTDNKKPEAESSAETDLKADSLKETTQIKDTEITTEPKTVSVTAKAAPKIKTSTSSEADEQESNQTTDKNANDLSALNDEENGIFKDYDLLEGDDISVDTATESNAEPAERVSTGYSEVNSDGISLMAEDEEDEASGGYLRDTETFEASQANQVVPPDNSIIDWTFVVYNHRTEGEIHFNKRDFDLNNDEGDNFDSYGQENADGSLEGAVYGLFAVQDIIHPDTDSEDSGEYDTGVVYKKDNLVAVATTDRNGDASFMVFTEAPGYTYDYETGRIVKTDDGWADEAPKNLYTNQADADAREEDAERFVGHTPANEEIEITDSNAGDETYYEKLSSNQGVDDTWCDEETTGYMPILNNEDNNGNCWIGRPLIVGKDGMMYYIKELSRSEGYELSVYGKNGELITNKDAFEDGETTTSSGSVSADKINRDVANGGLTYTVKSNGTDNGYTVYLSNIPEGATISKTAVEMVWDDSVGHYEEKLTDVPIMADEGTLVTVGGHTWEAQVGDTIEYNGQTFQVNNVYTITHDKQKVNPDNAERIENANLNPALITATGDVMEDVNAMFNASGFRNVPDGAPWTVIEVDEYTAEAIAAAVNEQIFGDEWYDVFNAMEMKDSYQQGGRYYIVIGYCYRYRTTNNALYNESNDSVYVKTSVDYDGLDNGFIYRVYSNSECEDVETNGSGFITSATVPNQIAEGTAAYHNGNPYDTITFKDRPSESFWAYASGEQLLNQDGSPAYKQESKLELVYPTLVSKVTNTEVAVDSYTSAGTSDSGIEYGTYQYTITQDELDALENGEIEFRITFNGSTADSSAKEQYAFNNGSVSVTLPMILSGTYIEDVTLLYPGEDIIISDGGTTVAPTDLYERPIRQKVKVSKDIQTLAEPKTVWYCLNCGNENQDGTAACGFCGTERTTEETKTIRYAHDTYSAVHKENISADRDAGFFDTVTDWLTSLLGGTEENDSAADIPNFRFKAYLKSNLERLYRDEDGNVIWMDRNGNTITPQYEDTNGDGNYDTFTWKYDEAYDGKTVDFPEKDIVSDDGTLESANVQKIYTKVKHVEDSDTTSAQANNVWSDYEDPQSGATENAGEKNGYSTSLRETADGESGDLSGMAVRVNDALYSYDGKNTNTDETDRINDGQNSGYTRILETRRVTMEDNDATREVEMYNYEKFFDGIAAANADIWDDDMHSTFTGDSMANYPGQHWFETFYEKYQKDDADPDHTLENTDGADADNTAGGDRDTSFKPFRWIRENVFGDRSDYEKYPAEHNGENTEVTTSTSDFAKANAEASDAVRQFATKWYLEDEAAKLMTANGIGEDIAKDNDGEIEYDEAVYDEALFNAIAKAYNYLKPFYVYDLDTIYSVEWDSESDGGADNDYTTLSIDNDGGEEYYNISGYLPYGTYVIVEQQPQRIDDSINDWENRSYTIEKPKEVILPAVYDAEASNDTTDNYDTHYNYSYTMDLQDQAASDNYLIRFGEEWPHNNSQDEREYVIRAHNYFGDFEVYKYGLDIDKLQDTITYDGGDYAYAGFGITQEEFDPLKDYYETTHRGEAGVPEIGKENGGNDASHLYAIDKTDGAATANGTTYDGDQLEDRFFYGSISEDAGIADDVMYKGGTVDDNNASGMQWKDGVRAMTGELTAYEGKYASMLVPWTVTAPADLDAYSSDDFSGYADVNMRDGFFTTTLRVNKVDSETGEYILHDNAIFALYAGSRYQSFEEIEEDAKLIEDPEEKAMFLEQFKPGDAKFYLQDTVITGSREFLMAMGAKDITKAARGRSSVVESGTGAGELYSGTVPKGTSICLESERIMLTDEVGARTGQMTVYTTLADVLAEAEDGSGKREYINQNIGWFETPQPIGAGVYVLAEIKAPAGYARSKPVAYEVYSDGTYYYPDGDMYGKVKAVRYEKNLIEDFEYQE